MGNKSALVVQRIAKALPLNVHSDERLIKAIAAGDQGAMRTLYARHSVRVFRFISRLVTEPSSAEDLMSEVFIDVWGQAVRFEGRPQVTTWILSIARFKALSALQRHRRRDAELDKAAMELIDDAADSPEQTALNSDLSAQLRTCLSQMSQEHREVIDLVYYREKTIEEVADIMRTPKNTVKSRMHYARKRLAGLLSTHSDFDHRRVRRAA
jgi:RNA polymerase sigma-70 factor, ECF subfamily